MTLFGVKFYAMRDSIIIPSLNAIESCLVALSIASCSESWLVIRGFDGTVRVVAEGSLVPGAGIEPA